MKATRNRVKPPMVDVSPHTKRQRGATLIVALVMLLIISLLAIGGMQGSVMQERMASNAHDSAISFQASEATLRQSENDILNTPGTRVTAFSEAMPASMRARSTVGSPSFQTIRPSGDAALVCVQTVSITPASDTNAVAPGVIRRKHHAEARGTQRF